MVAIGLLIESVVGGDKPRRCELALATSAPGTRTAEKALRRLSELIRDGARLDDYEPRLAVALGVPPEVLQDAVADTREELRLTEQLHQLQCHIAFRQAFRPHVFMIGESKVPSQITMFGLTGGNRHRILQIQDENFLNRPVEEQLEEVRKLIGQHQEEKKGMIPFFGNAVFYLYRPTPDGGGIPFDPQGRIMASKPDVSGHFGTATIRIK
jgi:hypothetical protein